MPSSTPPMNVDSQWDMLTGVKKQIANFLLDQFVVKAQTFEYGHHVRRADTDKLRQVFERYATVQKDGELYMTPSDFIVKYIGLGDYLHKQEQLKANHHSKFRSAGKEDTVKKPEAAVKDDETKDAKAKCVVQAPQLNEATVQMLGSLLDTSKDGLISFSEFQAFESILCKPDSVYRTAFQLFDTNGSGFITSDEFESIIKRTTLHRQVPFDFAGDFMRLHFGGKRDRSVTYDEFSQILHEFHEEHAIQAFKRFDQSSSGAIKSLDFAWIMQNVKSHLLSEEVRENLVAISRGLHAGSNLITFPSFMAFNTLLNNMELIKRIFISYAQSISQVELTKEQFVYAAQQMSHQITPLEIDILFELATLLDDNDGKITLRHLERIEPYRPQRYLARPFFELKLGGGKKPEEGRSIGVQVLENVYRFALGSIAGAAGATLVYPIDLVKTRMQNQRTGSLIGELMYRNSFDCFKKVVRHEGVFGLYRGLLPQLVGVCPEKAIKLTVNDFVRDKFTDKKGTITVSSEIFAGAAAGASQVMFTNPLEIVKIRLQVAGEITTGPKVKAWDVIKSLGFRGLYKGAKACFLRDIPFSAIYFPAYSHMKSKFADENGHNSPGSLLVSACIAGVPAAYLVTPADVIKTRLQVAAREGQTRYNGVIDATKKIWAEEGGTAFWKGGPARVLRSAPQFGFTLLTYEVLQRFFYIDFGGRSAGAPKTSVTSAALASAASGGELISSNPDHLGGYKLALATFAGIESKFGLSFPKYNVNV